MAHRKSQRLRLRDLRDIYRLIGECRDLGADSLAWREHMYRKLAHLFGAQVGCGGDIRGLCTGRVEVMESVDLGWEGEAERQRFLDYMAVGGPLADPMFQRFQSMQDRPLATLVREQVIDDRSWYKSDHFNEYLRVSRIDHRLVSFSTCTSGGPDVLHTISFHRALGDKPFGLRERRILQWFHHELAPLVGRQLDSAAKPSPAQLSPRMQQTLLRLLKGDSEKQVAHRLGLSRDTVHQYVKGIYRHFGVNSRSELMAEWAWIDERVFEADWSTRTY